MRQAAWLMQQNLLDLISDDIAGLRQCPAAPASVGGVGNGYGGGWHQQADGVSVVSSPLKRPLQTAHHAGLGSARCILLDPDLQEEGEAPCDVGSSREEILQWSHSRGINVSELSLPAGWEHKTGINAASRIAARMARFAASAREGRYGSRFIAVSHDKALQQLLHLDGVEGPSWNDRAWVPFQNCEARGYWMLGDGRWFPIPEINFRPSVQ
eukprot:TRINITY_DN13998_c0_g1_i2.p1 TRINITY_DN13998_c0_g1~~TRINITY_DN13998_c0_g1_i2.p1  ORF type:complete len:212 (+),score=35.84 TRINITY_DN13998_c0_g1_i2:164-799(+)